MPPENPRAPIGGGEQDTMGVLSYLKKPSAFLWRAFSPSRESPEAGDQESEEAKRPPPPPEDSKSGPSGSVGPSPLVVQAWEATTAANRQQRTERSDTLLEPLSLPTTPPPPAAEDTSGQ